MPRLSPGDLAPARTLHAVDGSGVVPDPKTLLHLHFSRFADCPVCNVHIAQLRRGTPELEQAGVRLAVLFHSPADSRPRSVLAPTERKSLRTAINNRGARI